MALISQNFGQHSKRFTRHHDIWLNITAQFARSVDRYNLSQEEEALAWQDRAGTSPSHGDIFSEFVFKRACDGNYMHVPIEPLAGTTRHPLFCALDGYHIMDMSHLYMGSGVGALHEAGSGRAFLFDLGSGLFRAPEEESGGSQHWLVNTFRKRGVIITDVYAWESKKLDPADVWDLVPAELAGRYHWFNIPVSLDAAGPHNPLTVLRQVARPGDYIIVKLDIDHPRLERELVTTIISDASLHTLIDEMFFEHQLTNCRKPPCFQLWPEDKAVEETLVDAYSLYTTLRSLGILAHSWI